jgi:hypothetical protein
LIPRQDWFDLVEAASSFKHRYQHKNSVDDRRNEYEEETSPKRQRMAKPTTRFASCLHLHDLQCTNNTRSEQTCAMPTDYDTRSTNSNIDGVSLPVTGAIVASNKELDDDDDDDDQRLAGGNQNLLLRLFRSSGGQVFIQHHHKPYRIRHAGA